MNIAAQVACYIQPITDAALLKIIGIVTVNVDETAVIRGTAENTAEAEAIIERAREVARALGRPVAIKKVVCRWGSDRLPRGVRKLAGTEVANVL